MKMPSRAPPNTHPNTTAAVVKEFMGVSSYGFEKNAGNW